MPDPQTPRFGEFLHRLLITKGYGQANVLDDYFPIVDMLSNKPELMKFRDERGFLGGGRGLGAASATGRVWCMNKRPSQLAMIEYIFVSADPPGLGVVFVDLTTIGLPADGAGGQSVGHSMDSRYDIATPGGTPPAPVTFANDTSGVTSGVGFTVTGGSVGVVFPVRYVLRPGYALVLSNSAMGVGANFSAAFMGYARGVEDSELK